MADERKRVGDEVEEAVSAYLEAKGHRILARNWRAGHLELDIVSLDLDGVHFVEVKTRRPPLQLDPQECVTLPKQKRTAKAAAAFLARSRNPHLTDCECHFDVAAVVKSGENIEIRFFPDAFIPIFI